MEKDLQDKSYEESLASDIFKMLETAKSQGLDLTSGFQNEPLATPKMSLRYMFYTKKELLQVPDTPPALKKKFKHSNVLAAVLKKGALAGLHLICTLDKPFADVESEEEVLKGMDADALDAYAKQMREALKTDMEQAIKQAQPPTDTSQ